MLRAKFMRLNPTCAARFLPLQSEKQIRCAHQIVVNNHYDSIVCCPVTGQESGESQNAMFVF